MAHKGVVKFSIAIVKLASWLMLVVFGVAGVTQAISVLRGIEPAPDATPIPKWAAPLLLLVLWGVGLFVFALYYLIGTAIELLAEIRDNTRRV